MDGVANVLEALRHQQDAMAAVRELVAARQDSPRVIAGLAPPPVHVTDACTSPLPRPPRVDSPPPTERCGRTLDGLVPQADSNDTTPRVEQQELPVQKGANLAEEACGSPPRPSQRTPTAATADTRSSTSLALTDGSTSTPSVSTFQPGVHALGLHDGYLYFVKVKPGGLDTPACRLHRACVAWCGVVDRGGPGRVGAPVRRVSPAAARALRRLGSHAR